MARIKRKRSGTGIYHIMLRGLDRRNIFLDDEDRAKFLQTMIKAKERGGFYLYAYCLMDNHVHLLIKENEEIGVSIKRITVSYVWWHNTKYARTGHLFQNRYRSEVVESEAYFLTVLRYIHQNPVKAKIVQTPSKYCWSSYNRYIDYYSGSITEIEIDVIKTYFQDKESFEDYMIKTNYDKCLEYESKVKYTDEILGKLLSSEYHIDQVDCMSKIDRDKLILKIREETGVSIRQLAVVSGLGRGIIERASRNMTKETSS